MKTFIKKKELTVRKVRVKKEIDPIAAKLAMDKKLAKISKIKKPMPKTSIIPGEPAICIRTTKTDNGMIYQHEVYITQCIDDNNQFIMSDGKKYPTYLFTFANPNNIKQGDRVNTIYGIGTVTYLSARTNEAQVEYRNNGSYSKQWYKLSTLERVMEL